MSRVSVTIATYARSAMVRQAVEAALSQTRKPQEVIVADDASPDDTLAVLGDVASRNPSVRIIKQSKNTGGVPNWNTALSAAGGEYLAWCSDDDRFLPDHLEVSIAYLESHPEVGLVHSGFVDAVETKENVEWIWRPLRFPQPFQVDRRNLIRYLIRYYDWPFHPSTIVMRRKVWEGTGPFDAQYALADTDWFVRAAERFATVLLPRHGVLNRRHPGNWSNRLGSVRMQQEIRSIVEGAIDRRWSRNALARMFFKFVWRTNVRLRLLLTLRARLRTAQKDAAVAAWNQLAQGLPAFVERAGEGLIRRWCAGREPSFRDARQSVSPL